MEKLLHFFNFKQLQTPFPYYVAIIMGVTLARSLHENCINILSFVEL